MSEVNAAGLTARRHSAEDRLLRARAFVVSPFGVKEVADALPGGSAGTVDFDEVYELLLGPALEHAGCSAFRADKESAAGDIRTDMFFELVSAEAVVADISILNPNVFYELGVRHGVTPRGVFMVHGGWSRRPFDVAPDRTFGYSGALFDPSLPRDAEWAQRVSEESARLGDRLRRALEVDEQGVGSPVYAALPGLIPADWTRVESARAKYFTGVLDDWRRRVRVAQRNGLAGDILTLADDVPTRFHRAQLLFEAARGLIALGRFRAARPVLVELLEMEPAHFAADCLLGLVLGRLGQVNEAEEHMRRVASLRPGDPEACGMLGRTYKGMWRARWEQRASLDERRQAAVSSAGTAAHAARAYDAAFRRHFDYYTGVNIVALVRVMERLAQATGLQPAAIPVTDADDLEGSVRVAAKTAYRQATDDDAGSDADEMIWASATLGELAVLAGDGAGAAAHYGEAAGVPGVSWFQLESMQEQLSLYDLLGYDADAVAAALRPVRDALAQLPSKAEGFRKVVVASGHMIDRPGRPQPRFPPAKEAAVRALIADQLDAWEIGEGCLAICEGARGTDTLFAEECLRRGVHVRLLISLPQPDFLAQSVRLPDSDWEERHFRLLERCEVAYQPDRLGQAPKDASVFSRTNRWIINTARAEADADPAMQAAQHLYALLVWDERPTGDGPGGTSDFAAALQRLGGRLRVINPTRIDG